MSATSAIQMDWLGHPGDSPNDVRARRFLISWPDIRVVNEDTQCLAQKNRQPVWRWVLYCGAIHELEEITVGEKLLNNAEVDAGEVVDDDKEENVLDLPKAKRWRVCSTDVRIHVCHRYFSSHFSVCVWLTICF